MEGMESLLRQLAGNAGIMPDLPAGAEPTAGTGANTDAGEGAGSKGKEKAMSPEEEEAAWQKALESVLSGEGLRAMGLDDPSTPAPSSSSAPAAPASTSAPSAPSAAPPKPSFDDTIRRTLDSLKSGSAGPAGTGAGAGSASASAGLEEFLRQMGHDPSALDALNGLEGLDGLDGLDGGDDLGGILDGMMSQLMNKEILEEPMAELEAKVGSCIHQRAVSRRAPNAKRLEHETWAHRIDQQYPAYLASPPPSTPAADLEKYKQQHTLVKQILATFRKPTYSDAEDSKEIARLVGDMQDLGGPPKEIMGDMPEGFVSGPFMIVCTRSLERRSICVKKVRDASSHLGKCSELINRT